MLFRFSPPWDRNSPLPVSVYCVKSIVVSEMGETWQVLVFAACDLPGLKHPAVPKRALQLLVAQVAGSVKLHLRGNPSAAESQPLVLPAFYMVKYLASGFVCEIVLVNVSLVSKSKS